MTKKQINKKTIKFHNPTVAEGRIRLCIHALAFFLSQKKKRRVTHPAEHSVRNSPPHSLSLSLSLTLKMALNLSLSAPSIRSPQQPLLHYSAKHTIVVSSDGLSYPKSTVSRSSGSRRVVTRVRSSLDIVGPTVKVGQVTEVDKDTFWPLVKAADDKTVVLDMYTQWYILIYIPVLQFFSKINKQMSQWCDHIFTVIYTYY